MRTRSSNRFRGGSVSRGHTPGGVFRKVNFRQKLFSVASTQQSIGTTTDTRRQHTPPSALFPSSLDVVVLFDKSWHFIHSSNGRYMDSVVGEFPAEAAATVPHSSTLTDDTHGEDQETDILT